MQDVQPAGAGQLGDGWDWSRCVPRGGSEQQAKALATRPELRLRPEGQIDLQRVRKQEDAVERGAMGDVQVVNGGVLPVHQVRPVGNHRRAVGVSTDAQSEVDVRPAILATQRGRPRQRGATDASIGSAGGDQPVAQPLAIVNGEHGRGDYGPTVARSVQAVSTSGAPFRTTTVCSTCADCAPSLVRDVQPSPVARTAPLPAEMIGSMVSTKPSVSGCESCAT